MEDVSGSLMVASSDGRDRRHVSCDARLNTARTDTRIVFNKHDAHTMRVWQQHIDATLDQKGLLNAATTSTLSFDDWAAVLRMRTVLAIVERSKYSLVPTYNA